MGSAIEIVIELVIFGAAVLLFTMIVREFELAIERRRRLGVQGVSGQSALRPLLSETAVQNSFQKWIEESTSISNSEERQKLRRQLMLAGFNSPNAPVWYVVIRFSLAIGLPLLFLLLQSLSSHPETGAGMIVWPLGLCGLGLLAPSRILASRISARQTQMEYEFPDALDLLVVCVEAGLSLDASFVRIGREIGESHPRIGEEFGRVSEQLRAGRARSDALRAMADRTGVGAIKSFVALLVQTEMLGSSIAQTLRTYSSEMRETRYLKAEEKAMRIPVLLSVPLVGCILPVIVAVALLPALIDFARTMMPAMAGIH
jgi:tight adherence protein C